MDKELQNFIDLLKDKKPEEWDRIPDIELYMDQVIAFMTRQHIGLDEQGKEALTSAMVNNYIKKGLLPRAKGKKYNKEHIAYLTAICLFKQVLSVDETNELLKWEMKDTDIEGFYEKYCRTLNEEFSSVAETLEKPSSEEEMRELALRLAVSGYGQLLACKKILQVMDKGSL